MAGIVYVVQNQLKREGTRLVPKFNLDPAKQYGPLKFLLTPNANPFKPEHAINELTSGLEHFDQKDHLLLIGNPCLIGWAVTIAAYAADGPINLLQWHGKDRRYIPVTGDPLGPVMDLFGD